MSDEQQIIAVSAGDHAAYGCPYCGYRSGYTSVSWGRTTVWLCDECDTSCAILADGATQSDIGFGKNRYHPVKQDHPRFGTPKHGRRDERPAGGGEFFTTRGIGLDHTPGCFVCDGENGMRHNISAFVLTKSAGERVVAMFQRGARLDYRDAEPDRVQVKIGACDDHVENLTRLQALTEGGVITEADVEAATSFSKV